MLELLRRLDSVVRHPAPGFARPGLEQVGDAGESDLDAPVDPVEQQCAVEVAAGRAKIATGTVMAWKKPNSGRMACLSTSAWWSSPVAASRMSLPTRAYRRVA